MRLNRAQQKRIKRAVRLAELSNRQKQASVSVNDKTAQNGLRAVIWRGIAGRYPLPFIAELFINKNVTNITIKHLTDSLH